MEHHKRSIAKSITWRLFSFVLTVIIIFVYTKNIKQALGVGAGIDLTKLALYYFHERLWNKVHFGRQKAGDYQI
jgi:uncharacterized membrane protein